MTASVSSPDAAPVTETQQVTKTRMSDQRTVLVCSCDDTMPLDLAALRQGCRGAEVVAGRQLCRAELERFRALAASGAPITVGCTQEAPLFREVAAESGSDVSFANLRESAGWSGEARSEERRVGKEC